MTRAGRGQAKTYEQQLEDYKNQRLKKAAKKGLMVPDESNEENTPMKRIRDHYILGTDLNDQDEKTRQLIERAWALKIKYGPHKAMTMFRKLTNLKRSYSYMIFKLAKEVLPTLDEMTKKSSKSIQIERYGLLIEKINKSSMDDSEKYALILKINERIDKISGLENDDLDMPSVKEILTLPQPVIFLNYQDYLKNKTINIDGHQ